MAPLKLKMLVFALLVTLALTQMSDCCLFKPIRPPARPVNTTKTPFYRLDESGLVVEIAESVSEVINQEPVIGNCTETWASKCKEKLCMKWTFTKCEKSDMNNPVNSWTCSCFTKKPTYPLESIDSDATQYLKLKSHDQDMDVTPGESLPLKRCTTGLTERCEGLCNDEKYERNFCLMSGKPEDTDGYRYCSCYNVTSN